MAFIENPSLPERRVTLAAASYLSPEILKSLNSLGVEIITVYPYKNYTENPESAHADMQLLHLGNKKTVVLKGSALKHQLEIRGFDVLETQNEPESFKYPQCAVLNCAILGEYIIGNAKYINKLVTDKLPERKIVSVSQGYAKCSTAVVAKNAIITSDISIYIAARKSSIDCLKISEGNIRLCEHYGGFIGGCCFKLDKNTLAFTGDIKLHPDYIKIKSFCSNYGVSLLSLTKGELYDIGGIIPLEEEAAESNDRA